MRIALCDDEPFFISQLHKQMKERYDSLDLLIDLFDSGENLVSYYRKGNQRFDIIFLDIEMCGIDGFQTAKSIRSYDPRAVIVFVTSHEELACKGYEVSAHRFLTKPLDIRKMMEAVESARTELLQTKTILVQNPEGTFKVRLDDIICFEAQNQQVEITALNRTYLHRRNISDYEAELNGQHFYRIHRSYLINLRYVTSFNKTEIIMETGISLPLSRLRYNDFEKKFHDYIRLTAF